MPLTVGTLSHWLRRLSFRLWSFTRRILLCRGESLVFSYMIFILRIVQYPRWGYFIAVILATISILFFGALYAITGLSFIIQPFVQMIGGFIHPGKPMVNMYFVLFSYSAYRGCRLSWQFLDWRYVFQTPSLKPSCCYETWKSHNVSHWSELD